MSVSNFLKTENILLKQSLQNKIVSLNEHKWGQPQFIPNPAYRYTPPFLVLSF